MNDMPDIALFMEEVRKDPRIGPLHISLYLAIYCLWIRQGRSGLVRFTAKELMPVAKIGGGTPFYRCMKQLHAYGYVVYEPSFNAAAKSRVSLVRKGE